MEGESAFQLGQGVNRVFEAERVIGKAMRQELQQHLATRSDLEFLCLDLACRVSESVALWLTGLRHGREAGKLRESTGLYLRERHRDLLSTVKRKSGTVGTCSWFVKAVARRREAVPCLTSLEAFAGSHGRLWDYERDQDIRIREEHKAGSKDENWWCRSGYFAACKKEIRIGNDEDQKEAATSNRAISGAGGIEKVVGSIGGGQRPDVRSFNPTAAPEKA